MAAPECATSGQETGHDTHNYRNSPQDGLPESSGVTRRRPHGSPGPRASLLTHSSSGASRSPDHTTSQDGSGEKKAWWKEAGGVLKHFWC